MDLTLISKYRTQLMGFSILIIVFYHFFGIGGSSFIDIAFRKLFSQGYVGVDFFMFSSGLGLVYSISKTENLKDYFIKRWVRIFPFFTFITLIECFVIRGESLGLSLLRSTTIGYYIGVSYIDWFVPALVGLYIVFPLLYFIVVKPKRYILAFLLMMFFVILSLYASIVEVLDWKHYALLYRIPIFILGTITASAIKCGYKPIAVKRVIIFSSIIGIVVAAISKGMGGKYTLWLFNACFTPLYLFILMKVFDYISSKRKMKWGGQFGLAFYGMFTLELYRVSSSFERLLEDTVTPDYHWIFVLLYFILSVILAWICHKVFKFINAFLYKKLKVIFKV